MNDTLRIHEKIESIKSSLGGTGASDKSDQWIQRQNLQDLYHQVILDDIDFTIDKKLEQDLWNYVFKNQINYFQKQIKDKKNSRRNEAQASLFFFLEAARGFYTQLLEDIVLTYELELPFCQRFNFLSGDYFSKRLHASHSDDKLTKEKQLMYICQNILTHLGDIARYANMFDQAKMYYLHAIKLLPYLGQPYNQIGILFETSRVNQLATAFYYMRSIAVKYTFPLAATNLENFLQKLTEIPLARYSESGNLAFKDYIQLFLQINALIYTCQLAKLPKFIALFHIANVSTSISFEKLDSSYLCQMMSILFFMLNKFQSSPSQLAHAQTLFTSLIEQCVNVVNLASFTDEHFIMPGLYLAFSFIDSIYRPSETSAPSLVFGTNTWPSLVKILNSFMVSCEMLADVFFTKLKDYPLEEIRTLDAFIPLKDVLKEFNFREYNYKSFLSDKEECNLRKLRLVVIFRHLASLGSFANCITCFTNENTALVQFKLASDEVTQMQGETLNSIAPVTKTQSSTSVTSLPSELMSKSPAMVAQQQTTPKESPTSAQSQRTKRRQNLAISSLTQKQQMGQQPRFTPPTPSFYRTPLPVQQTPIRPQQFTNRPQLSNPMQFSVSMQQQQHQAVSNFYQVPQLPFAGAAQYQRTQQLPQNSMSSFPSFLPETRSQNAYQQPFPFAHKNSLINDGNNFQQQHQIFQQAPAINEMPFKKHLINDGGSGPVFPSFFDNKGSFQSGANAANQMASNDLMSKLSNSLFDSAPSASNINSDIPIYSNLKNIWSNGSLNAANSNKSNEELQFSNLLWNSGSATNNAKNDFNGSSTGIWSFNASGSSAVQQSVIMNQRTNNEPS